MKTLTNYPEHLRKFVAVSTTDQQLIDEFNQITEEYDELARKLAASGIPQRRATIILKLIQAQTPRRTYEEVGNLLGGLSSARVGQILKAAQRRAAIAAHTAQSSSTTSPEAQHAA